MRLSRCRLAPPTSGLVLTLVLAHAPCFAAEPKISLVIRNHRFEPSEVHIPANSKIKLMVRNLDATPEEFESYELKREKVIPGDSEAPIFVGPLAPGAYPFFGDFNQATAQGRVIVE